MWVYLQDQFVHDSKAKVSVFDRGFLYGDSIFETMAAYRGKIFRLNQHLSRLAQSASIFELNIPFSPADLALLLYKTLDLNEAKKGTLRLSVSRGSGIAGFDPGDPLEPTLVIIYTPAKNYPQSMYDQGALLSTTKIRRNPVAALNPLAKCGNFLNNIMAYSEARRNGCHEAIMFSMEGYIAEGATSNIFLVENDQVFTPSIDTGIMPGITRGVVLELCKQFGISIHEKKLLPENLFSAQEIFYTNTSVTIMPVGRIDNRSMPQPVPGQITQRLRKEISSIIEQETDPLWVC